MELREDLADWTDWDFAAYGLGLALGIFPPTGEFHRVKHLFWSDNALGVALHDVLMRLVDAGVLERRDEPDIQFRWRADSARVRAPDSLPGSLPGNPAQGT
ncbi:hypothetical protein [Actinosynnema sp. NPDC023587]|uniref:hypothetical protein n=1 Tax=Actinosynnema sp. NPDC023587 TaxID=3154695 RepID=UPI0033F00211